MMCAWSLMGWPSSERSSTSPTKSNWRKIIARCSWPCLEISASFWLNWLTACIICAPSSICARISKNAFLVKLWRSMRHSPTVSGFPVSSGSWRICLSVIWMRQNSTRFLTWWRKSVVSEKSWSKKSSTRLRPMQGNAICMEKFMAAQSTSTRSTARCRIRRSALMKSMIWLPSAVFWILQAMSMLCIRP